ncbi:MAG: DNA gyrase subunit A [Asticcacaulis sp.]
MTGRGSVVTRGKASIETIRKDREAIVITEIPYQVNKAAMIEHIAELVREKRIEGISDVRDESDRQGMRVVVELKREARATSSSTSFTASRRCKPRSASICWRSIMAGPQQMGLRRLLDIFLEFREDVVVRRIRFELNKARDRGHTLVGLSIAVANIDEVIHIIRSSADPAEARRTVDRPRLAVGRYGADDRTDRRSALDRAGRRQCPPDRRTGARHPGLDPVAPDRSWPR